jgi:arginyl-tRNA synthetase
LRRAEEQPVADQITAIPNEKETILIRKVSDFAGAVAEAGRTYSPALIANYCYDLAKEFNQFYHDYSILKEEDANIKALRLLISAVVARTLKAGVALLGMEMPERM